MPRIWVSIVSSFEAESSIAEASRRTWRGRERCGVVTREAKVPQC
jgi:hypothetical protein